VQQFNFVFRQEFSFRGHVLIMDHFEKKALLGMAWDDGGATLSAREDGLEGAQVQIGFFRFDAVALEAGVRHDALDVLYEAGFWTMLRILMGTAQEEEESEATEREARLHGMREERTRTLSEHYSQPRGGDPSGEARLVSSSS